MNIPVLRWFCYRLDRQSLLSYLGGTDYLLVSGIRDIHTEDSEYSCNYNWSLQRWEL